jgi:predicted RNase H-like HicB family nuclease
MLGPARNDGAGKLDAIIYRAGTRRAFYVSEHATSLARGRDFHSCLDNLSRQVRDDVETGLYPPADRGILHTFVTTVDVALELRDGCRKQPFVCRVDETVDARDRVTFESQCPTNYLLESGRSLADAAAKLKDVIAARYEGESIADLMRELPKRPMMTSFALRKNRPDRWVSAAIRRENGGYEALSLEAPASARGSDPFVALRNLESALSDVDLSRAPVMKGEPVYCTLDVPLHLKENTVTRRFFVSVSRYNGSSLPFYASRVPQAGLSLRAKTFEDALDAARDAIALEYHEKSADEVNQALKKQYMLTAARVPMN